MPPYTDSTLSGGGLATKVVSAVFEEIGMPFQLEWESWKRGYNNTKQKRYLGTFLYSKNEERMKEMV